jgi:putative FmdB family regulatory protein
MPIFEYKCLDCGASFEKLQKAGSIELLPCPFCGSEKTQKEFSAFAAPGGTKSAVSTPSSSCFSGGGG